MKGRKVFPVFNGNRHNIKDLSSNLPCRTFCTNTVCYCDSMGKIMCSPASDGLNLHQDSVKVYEMVQTVGLGPTEAACVLLALASGWQKLMLTC